MRQQLHDLPPQLAITELDQGDGGSAATLTRMYVLHSQLRDLLPGNSTRWVTAAKLCARKRPSLFPVRDNLVCEYLAGGRALKRGDGWPGDFSIDLQVYAFLMTSPEVVGGIATLRKELAGTRGPRLDTQDLRLLDSALWKAAVAASG